MKALGVFLISSIALLASCSKAPDNNNQAQTITFELSNTADKLLSDIDIDYMVLNDSNAIIGSVDKVRQNDSVIFISDSEEYKLLAFDSNGNYIGQIGSKGQGAGEFIRLSTFFIDSDNNRIGIWDEERRKVIYYDLHTFNLIEETSYPEIVSSCCVNKGNSLIWYNQEYEGSNSGYYFISTGSDGKITNRYVPKYFKSGYQTGSSQPLYSVNNKVYGYTPYQMTLYELNDSSFNPYLNISVKDFDTPSTDYLNRISDNGRSNSLFSNLEQSDYISFYSVYEGETILLVNIIRSNERFVGIYDKLRGNSYMFEKSKFAEMLKLGAISYFVPNTLDGKIIGVLDRFRLSELASEGIVLDERLSNLLSDDNENQILVKIGFK